MDKTLLFLSRADTTYVFHNEYVKSVTAFSFDNRVWKLKNSNDPTFAILDSLHLLPTLLLTDNSEYIVEWNVSPKNLVGSNGAMGFTGLVKKIKSDFMFIPVGRTHHRD